MIQIAFWNGFWVFIGVVAGAGIQYRLMQRTVAKQREMAFKVLRTEAEMNCAEVGNFLERITYLKERVGAGQIETKNLLVSMQAFDYSALNPLVNSGNFHSMLSADDVRSLTWSSHAYSATAMRRLLTRNFGQSVIVVSQLITWIGSRRRLRLSSSRWKQSVRGSLLH